MLYAVFVGMTALWQAACTVLPPPESLPPQSFDRVGDSYKVDVVARDPWNESGIQLKKEHHYQMKIGRVTDWRDDKIPSSVTEGWKEKHVGFWAGIARSLFKARMPDAPWYALVGAVGTPPDGLEYFHIKQENMLFTPKQDGEFYLFANDYPSKGRYCNNHGTVTITITRMHEN